MKFTILCVSQHSTEESYNKLGWTIARTILNVLFQWANFSLQWQLAHWLHHIFSMSELLIYLFDQTLANMIIRDSRSLGNLNTNIAAFFVNNLEKVKMNFCSSSILNGCMKTAGNMNQHKHFNSHIASVRINKFNWWIMLLGVHFDVYIQTISNTIVCHLFHEKITPESFFNIQNAFHVPFIKILNQFFPVQCYLYCIEISILDNTSSKLFFPDKRNENSVTQLNCKHKVPKLILFFIQLLLLSFIYCTLQHCIGCLFLLIKFVDKQTLRENIILFIAIFIIVTCAWIDNLLNVRKLVNNRWQYGWMSSIVMFRVWFFLCPTAA